MIDKEYFKEKLEAEKALLEKELADVGRKNPDAKDDWVPAPADEAMVHADDNLAADDIEHRLFLRACHIPMLDHCNLLLGYSPISFSLPTS